MGQGAVSLAFFYPSTLLSFHKKEDDSWCSGSLGKGSKHTRAGLGILHRELSPFSSMHSTHNKGEPC